MCKQEKSLWIKHNWNDYDFRIQTRTKHTSKTNNKKINSLEFNQIEYVEDIMRPEANASNRIWAINPIQIVFVSNWTTWKFKLFQISIRLNNNNNKIKKKEAN